MGLHHCCNTDSYESWVALGRFQLWQSKQRAKQTGIQKPNSKEHRVIHTRWKPLKNPAPRNLRVAQSSIAVNFTFVRCLITAVIFIGKHDKMIQCSPVLQSSHSVHCWHAHTHPGGSASGAGAQVVPYLISQQFRESSHDSKQSPIPRRSVGRHGDLARRSLAWMTSPPVLDHIGQLLASWCKLHLPVSLCRWEWMTNGMVTSSIYHVADSCLRGLRFRFSLVPRAGCRRPIVSLLVMVIMPMKRRRRCITDTGWRVGVVDRDTGRRMVRARNLQPRRATDECQWVEIVRRLTVWFHNNRVRTLMDVWLHKLQYTTSDQCEKIQKTVI